MPAVGKLPGDKATRAVDGPGTAVGVVPSDSSVRSLSFPQPTVLVALDRAVEVVDVILLALGVEVRVGPVGVMLLRDKCRPGDAWWSHHQATCKTDEPSGCHTVVVVSVSTIEKRGSCEG